MPPLILLAFVLSWISWPQIDAARAIMVECPKGCFCPDDHVAQCQCNNEVHDVPQLLPLHISELVLSSCPFTELRPEQFKRYRNLTTLVLSNHQRLTKIEPFTFRGLNDLKVLAIRQNPRLTALTEGALGGIHADGSLVIHLDENGITDIHGYVFSDTRRVREINFDQNPIKSIRKHAFSGLYNVQRLNFPPNIQIIQPQAFDNFTQLHHLTLYRWQAARSGGVQPQTFKGLRYVSTISIKKSNLGIIHPLAFSSMFVVEQIRITDCNIQKLKRKSFVGTRNIGRLVISNNNIQRIERNFFDFVPIENKNQVQFTHNQIDCSCKNLWMLSPEFKDTLPMNLARDNYCSSPRELKERSLSMIPQQTIDRCLFLQQSKTATRRNYCDLVLILFVLCNFVVFW